MYHIHILLSFIGLQACFHFSKPHWSGTKSNTIQKHQAAQDDQGQHSILGLYCNSGPAFFLLQFLQAFELTTYYCRFASLCLHPLYSQKWTRWKASLWRVGEMRRTWRFVLKTPQPLSTTSQQQVLGVAGQTTYFVSRTTWMPWG